MKTESIENYKEISADEILKPEWITITSTFSYCEKNCIVKINAIELRVKDRTIKALKALSAGIRFQNSTTVLPTKEQLFFECGIPIDRNFREFKINKELFPYPELHGVVRFDRKRKGYFLCLNKSE